MAKTKAKGVIVKMATTSTPTTTLDQMAEVTFNSGSRSLIDTTTHDSATTMDYVDSGLRDTVELDISGEYDPANAVHEIARAAHDAGTLVYVTLILPDAGAATYVTSGYVTEWSVPAMTPRGSLKYSLKYKCAGVDTFTA